MNTTQPQSDGNRKGLWLRVLRPLLWWLVLVVLLFGYQAHKKLSKETRLQFSVVLKGEGVANEARVELDNKEFSSGELVSIGRHKLVIHHPKAQTFTTNLFILYGLRDLGTLSLTRSTGVLSVSLSPQAQKLTVRGLEYSVSYTQSLGMTSSVPTDRYIVEVQFLHCQDREVIEVKPDTTAYKSFVPKLGAISLESNQKGVEFTVRDIQSQVVEIGKMPTLIPDLPVGFYLILGAFGNDRRELSATVRDRETNNVRMDFVYGAARLESRPTGATVSTSDGHRWGVTPLTLVGLKPGSWKFTLDLRRRQ